MRKICPRCGGSKFYAIHEFKGHTICDGNGRECSSVNFFKDDITGPYICTQCEKSFSTLDELTYDTVLISMQTLASMDLTYGGKVLSTLNDYFLQNCKRSLYKRVTRANISYENGQWKCLLCDTHNVYAGELILTDKEYADALIRYRQPVYCGYYYYSEHDLREWHKFRHTVYCHHSYEEWKKSTLQNGEMALV